MVFWGTVVKPGSPFTLSDNRRLHLSQATLGVGSANAKSIVQCNVGDKTPLFLCTLVPEKMESCPLNLKYEEADEVVFSVIGSRSVHLTGYFEENSTNFPNNDDDDKTESFGEDIPETETERSETDDDDEYGGSFINDGDVEVFPTSPVAEVGKKSGRKKRRKLKRKCRIVESDNDDCSPVTATSKLALPNGEIDETTNKKDDTRLMKCNRSEPNNDNCSPVNATPKLFGIFDVSDSEEEDTRPIGSHLKHNRAFESLRIDSVGVERVNANSKNNLTEKESGTVTLSLENDLAALKPERDADMESVLGSDYDRLKDTVDNGDTPVPKVDNKTNDADACKSLDETVDNNNIKIDHKSHHPDVAEDSLENSIEELDGFVHTLPLSTQLGSDDEQKKQREKKKRKTAEDCIDVSNEVDQALKNGKLDSDADAGLESVLGSEHDRLKDTVDNGDTPVAKVDNKTDDADACKSLDETVDNNNVKIDHKSHHPDMAEDSLENSIEELDGFVHTLPLSTQLGSDDEQKKQRKKKKRKTAEDCKDVSNEVDQALKNGKLDSDAVFLINEDKSCLQSQQKERKRKKRNNSNIKDVEKSKKLPDGVVIEEQEIGNPDSKIATMGKRVKVHYVAKSLESGEVLLSNLDQAPLKFRLGAEGHDGWELGIEGMRVGGRRRISVPPSLGLLTEGASVEAAADSSLVYEVELVKVL